MTTSAPLSPTFSNFILPNAGRIHQYVEIYGQPKEASWVYKRAGPTLTFPIDLTKTRPEMDLVIRDLQFSDTKSDLWRRSTLLGYGSDACVRLEGDTEFPVIKFAHPKLEHRQRIQDEFEVMRILSHLKFVAKTSPEPLTDEEGILGFRLELLDKVEMEEATARKDETMTLLAELHRAGYCHGDLQFRNVMKRKDGELVLIDFGYAGALGRAVPDHVPRYMNRHRVYRAQPDLEHVQRFMGPFNGRNYQEVGVSREAWMASQPAPAITCDSQGLSNVNWQCGSD
jgi:serine/threonine protein kinase